MLASPVEIYSRGESYRFLLEVICGLNSPLVGETAVLGHSASLSRRQNSNTSWGNFLRQLISNLLVDAKLVRHEHPTGTRKSSYGSLVRQHLKGVPSSRCLAAANWRMNSSLADRQDARAIVLSQLSSRARAAR